MDLFLNVRESLGITQDELASLLGVQTGLYKMAEKHRRNLPQEALARLIWMSKTIESLPETNPITHTARDLATLLHKTRNKKRKLDQVLEESSTKWKQMQNRLAFQERFREQYPAEIYVAETGFMAGIAYNAQYNIQITDSQQELHRKATQVGLKAMMEFLEQHSKETPEK